MTPVPLRFLADTVVLGTAETGPVLGGLGVAFLALPILAVTVEIYDLAHVSFCIRSRIISRSNCLICGRKNLSLVKTGQRASALDGAWRGIFATG